MSLIARLRPQRATEILDSSFRFYREHAMTLLGIATLFMLPPAVVTAFVPPDVGRVVGLVANLLVPIGQAAMTVVVAAWLTEDRSITAGEALRRISGRVGTAVLVQIASGLLILVGLILVIAPGIVALIWTAVALPVVVLEGSSAGAAISRSRELARDRAGHVFATLALAWLILIAVVLGGGIAFGLLVALLKLGSSASEFLSSVLFIVAFPLLSVTTALLYYDLRIRAEGADLEAMVAELQ